MFPECRDLCSNYGKTLQENMYMHSQNSYNKPSSISIFSPTAFIILFIGCYLLYSLSLTRSIQPPSLTTTFYVVLCCVTFISAILFGTLMHNGANPSGRLTERAAKRADPTTRGAWLIFFVTISLYVMEHVLFVIAHGKPPIFIKNFEEARFGFAVNGYIHLIAISGRYCLLYILASKLSNPGKSGNYGLVYFSIIFTLALDIMLGNRGNVALFIFSIVILYSIFVKMSGGILAFGAAALSFLGLGKAYREYAMYGASSLNSVSREWQLGDGFLNASLYHLYMTFAYNFAVLDRYVNLMKDQFHIGYFTILQPFISLIPGKQYGLIDLQRDVLGVRFHGGLTATFLSYPFFDFGILGFIIIFIIGFASQRLYLKAKNDRSVINTTLYSYHAINMFLGIYTYLYGHFYVLIYYLLISNIIPATCRAVDGAMGGRAVARRVRVSH